METITKIAKGSKFEYVDPKLGETNTTFLSTDLSVQYLAHVINEKNEKGHNFYLTEGIILSDNSNEAVDDAFKILIEKYSEILENDPFTEGIYTVINVSKKLFGESHQNWIFLNIKNKQIVRYEPNGSKWAEKHKHEYRIHDLLNNIAKVFGYKVVYATKESINYFDGCRATSTLLILLDIMGIEYNALWKYNNFLPLAYSLSREIENQSCDLSPLKKTVGRRKKGLDVYVTPLKTPKEEVDLINLSVPQLKSYLKEKKIEFGKRDKKQDLLNLALRSQSSIILV